MKLWKFTFAIFLILLSFIGMAEEDESTSFDQQDNKDQSETGLSSRFQKVVPFWRLGDSEESNFQDLNFLDSSSATAADDNGDDDEVMAETDPLNLELGTKQWIHYYLDTSGLALCFFNDIGTEIQCPKCKKFNTIVFRPTEKIPLQCSACGFLFTEDRVPKSGVDKFERKKLEYSYTKDRKKIYWKPMLRYLKAQYAYRMTASNRSLDPEICKKRLNVMLAYSKYYRIYMVRCRGNKIFRPGYPDQCDWGRLTHFGDYVYPTSFCEIYQQIEKSGIRISQYERKEYRALLENIISEISLPFIRQSWGRGISMGAAFMDCAMVGRTFPEAEIVDYYTLTKRKRPKVLSGTDLVYETLEGPNGLENLISTYCYSDGLIHELSPAYQGMLAVGIKNALLAFEDFHPPAGYSPVMRGYYPFDSTMMQTQAVYRLPLTRYQDLAFPGGEMIPFGDATTWPSGKEPSKESDLFHSWGIGTLREKDTVAAMLWGNNLHDGHSHNDMLSLLYWGDGMLLLNTTECPKNGAAAPAAYWKHGAGAHNTVMIDGKNHTRSRGAPGGWGVTEHMKVMQGISTGSYPESTMRRTVFMVDSRRDYPPYLIDLFEVEGGRESHDYFLRVQSRTGELEETLSVQSPSMKKSGKSNLTQLLKNAETGNVYPFVTNPDSGAFQGNGSLSWEIPYQEKTNQLHAILVPDRYTENTLFTGDVPGVRVTGEDGDPADRTVREVIWRKKNPQGRRSFLKSCFFSVFEYSRDGESLSIQDAKWIKPYGQVPAKAVMVTHKDGTDWLILSNGTGDVYIESPIGRITFNGFAFLMSLNSEGKITKLSTTGQRSLKIKKLNVPGSHLYTGRIKGMPTGLAPHAADEENATVAVGEQLSEEVVGNMLLVHHRNGTASYRITAIKPLRGGGTQIQLDHSARKLILTGDLIQGGTGLRIHSGGGRSDLYAIGDYCVSRGRAFQIVGKELQDYKGSGAEGKLGYATIRLDRPVSTKTAIRLPVTEFGPNDPYTIMTSRTIRKRKRSESK